MSQERAELEKVESKDAPSMIRVGYARDPDMDAYLYGYDHEAEGNDFHLRDVWRAIRKHKWLIIIVPILVTAIVTVEVNRPRPIYQASAVVEIKKDAWVMVKSGDTVIEEEPDTALSSPTIKTKTLLLKSRPLLEDVAARLALDREPRFFDITQKKASFWETLQSLSPIVQGQEQSNDEEESLQGQTVETERTESEVPESNPDPELSLSDHERAALRAHVKVLRDNLVVEPIMDTRALNISFTHTNPKIAAAVANGVAESFIQRTFESRTSKFNSATAWLERTTRELREKVETAEKALSDYTRDHNIYAPEAKDTFMTDKLGRLHSEVLRVEMERVLKASLYEEVRAGRVAQLPEAFSDPKTSSLETQLGQLAVQAAQLDVTYGPKNPQVVELRQRMATIQSQIDQSRAALEERLKAEYERAVRDENSLKIALTQAKSEAIQQNQDAVRYNLLKQEAETTRSLYTQFLQKTSQANIQAADRPSNVRLIEPAVVPSNPVNANRPLYILFGFLGSLSACIGLAFLYEYLGKTIKSVEDVNRYIQLPAIGVIPAIKPQTPRRLVVGNHSRRRNGAESILKLTNGDSRRTVSLQDCALISEAYNAVSTSVLLSSIDSPPKTILFTSGLPGEGKTTTVANTAVSLSQLGASVLVIDCDLRNPTTHRLFNLENARGVSDYLSDDIDVDRLIAKSEIPNLALLPAGPAPENPAKLIISRKMKVMLQMLTERYDHILIDSPPLIGVKDAVILATLVDGVIVVVHGDKSTREIARRTRQELSTVGANIFGVVLNNIDHSDYHYYQPAYKYTDSTAESL